MLIGIIIAAVVGICLGAALFFYERNKTHEPVVLSDEARPPSFSFGAHNPSEYKNRSAVTASRTSSTRQNYSNSAKYDNSDPRHGGYAQTSDDTSLLLTGLAVSTLYDSSTSYDSCSSYDSGGSSDSGGSCGSD